MNERAAGQTLTADRVSFIRGGRKIVDEISLSATAGQLLAIVGPSGSGKSSLLALLAGLERPDSGTVTCDPVDARIGLILQGYGLVNLLTAAENVEIALQGQLIRAGITRAEIGPRAGQALAAVGLDDVAGHLVEELSGGQQQRVAIARALAVRPQVLLADELTAELDHESKTRVIDLVVDLARRGAVVVLATHDPDLAARCDVILRLADGHAIVEG
jgi:putative ABC transport system ATP-binding protein